ncbi:MAG: hypothetical protein AB1Z18_05585 [Desulfobacterales bacterium]|jgi:hypothetical protein
MQFGELDENGRTFLLSVYNQTKGDPAAMVSMYDVGSELGIDRTAASRLAEDLMGWMMLEIRTLSGGIGITPSAVEEIEASGFGGSKPQVQTRCLGTDPVISTDVRQAVERVTDALKQQVGSIGLPFDALAEVMADLKTVDAQFDSSHPKTAIVRACFQSLKNTLDHAGAQVCAGLVAGLLGE